MRRRQVFDPRPDFAAAVPRRSRGTLRTPTEVLEAVFPQFQAAEPPLDMARAMMEFYGNDTVPDDGTQRLQSLIEDPRI